MNRQGREIQTSHRILHVDRHIFAIGSNDVPDPVLCLESSHIQDIEKSGALLFSLDGPMQFL